MTTSAASTSVVGVIRFLRSGVAVLTVNPFETSALRRCRVLGHVAAGKECEPEEGDERRDQPLIERVLHAFGERGRRLPPDGRQPEFRERHAGEIAYLGAAGLVFAVDAFDVSAESSPRWAADFRRSCRAGTDTAVPAGAASRRSISCSSSLTGPNSEAPVGHTSQQAGILPSFCRWLQNWHFAILPSGLFRSNCGTPNGQP